MRLQLRHRLRIMTSAMGVGSLVFGATVASMAVNPGTASAATRPLCVGTTAAPGVLAGSYRSGVRIEGVCTVNGGSTIVRGRLVISQNSALIAAYALNDLTGKGTSRLTVFGTITVGAGGSLVLGCLASSFPCFDDPNSEAPTLSSADIVRGSIRAQGPLGVIVHDATIYGNVRETGGGGGMTCDVPTTGVFSLFNSSVYSDFEDSSIRGNVTVASLQTCWLGFARLVGSGNVTINDNTTADPDATEILANTISGNLTCRRNTSVWNSSEASFGQPGLYPRTPQPNTVNGTRSGQCVLASPATEGGPPGPGPF